VTSISFAADQYGLPTYQTADPKYQTLGAWLIGDVSNYPLVALDALAMVDEVSKGEEPFEPWSSENYDVAITPSGVTINNIWVESERGQYSLSEVREALESYWRFLASRPENPHLVREYRPDLPTWEADLLSWEEKWERTHPYRGRLF
jgi:hypothetical protein